MFVLRCISKGIVPVSLKLNSGRKDISGRARAITYRPEKQVLQERVRSINFMLLDIGSRIAAIGQIVFLCYCTNNTIKVH